MTDLRFDSIRSDWYAANTLVPRLVVKAVLRQESLRLVGFPSQWIPVAVHYGLRYLDPQPPRSYLPFFSDLLPSDVVDLTLRAKSQGGIRPLLESVAAFDPVLSDFIYIVDHKLAAAGHVDSGTGLNLLNTWHSFSRPEIVRLQHRMCRHSLTGTTFVMLPCSRHRPYDQSRTHARLTQLLALIPAASDANRVVVTALGVIPEAYWCEPLVLSYDAGAVDLWRVYQLLRAFFQINHAELVIDCLSFKPYSDMLRMLQESGAIDRVVRPFDMRWRGFHVKLK